LRQKSLSRKLTLEMVRRIQAVQIYNFTNPAVALKAGPAQIAVRWGCLSRALLRGAVSGFIHGAIAGAIAGATDH
jgi:hypothetical protein